MPIDDSLISMFHSTLRTGSSRDETLVEVPDSEVKTGPLVEGETYRVAVLGPVEDTNNENLSGEASGSISNEDLSTDSKYPVAEGERVEVVIEDIGDEGDGIAKVDGYAVIVPGADLNEELLVEINHTSSTHAFASVVGAHHTNSD